MNLVLKHILSCTLKNTSKTFRISSQVLNVQNNGIVIAADEIVAMKCVSTYDFTMSIEVVISSFVYEFAGAPLAKTEALLRPSTLYESRSIPHYNAPFSTLAYAHIVQYNSQ